MARSRSSYALIPAAWYRDRHSRTTGTLTPARWATSVCDRPSAASSTILARHASLTLAARDDAIPASFSRPPFRNARAVATHLLHGVRRKVTLLVRTLRYRNLWTMARHLVHTPR